MSVKLITQKNRSKKSGKRDILNLVVLTTKDLDFIMTN